MKRKNNKFSYKNRSLKFSFTATTYENVDNTRYQVILKGFDKSERSSEWTNIPFKEYTNLREGHYQFIVRAQNPYGTISKDAVFDFIIRPPLFRTFWAYVSYFFIILLIIFLIFRFIRRKHEKEKQQIELEKQQKLLDQHQKLEKANLQKEKLLVTLKEQKLKSEEKELKQNKIFLEKEKEKD
jgi:predicted phage tail protein